MDGTVEAIHRAVGYPLAFIIAPLALATYASHRRVRGVSHGSFGRWYFYVMTFLYITGTFLTLTRHAWGSWDFLRNLAFNFIGYVCAPLGVRAIVLFARPDKPGVERLDRVLAALLTAAAVTLIALSFGRSDPTVPAFAVIASSLAFFELRDLRDGWGDRSALYRRHLRYVLVSYFYVLTVASIVHLGDELPRLVKWLWPSAVGTLVVCASTAGSSAWKRYRAPSVRLGILTTVGIALLFGAYVGWEVSAGRLGNTPRPRPGASRPLLDPEAPGVMK